MRTEMRSLEQAAAAYLEGVTSWNLPPYWEREFPAVTEEEISAKARIHGNMKSIHHDSMATRRTLLRGENLLGPVASVSHLIGYIEATVSERFENSVIIAIEHLQLVSPLYAGALPRVACEAQVCRRVVRLKATIRNGSQIIAAGNGMLLPTEEETLWFPTDFVDEPE